MSSLSRLLITIVVGIGIGMIVIVAFHLGGVVALHVGQFAPVFGAFVGGSLVLTSTGFAARFKQNSSEDWTRSELLSWLLIGFGILAWGIGDSFWRYYVARGETPFPSLADLGYVIFPLLIFAGLLLQPQSNIQGRRLLLVMDSLISTGAILAIAWYLLLGSLTQATTEASLGKFLGLYYPTTDTALLSCIAFLLLRNQRYTSRARRVSLSLIGLGLCFFVISDFIFNIQQNAGTYVEATWGDLGWPLGMMTIGIAACVRRFSFTLPLPMLQKEEGTHKRVAAMSPIQYIPYGLVGWLFVALVSNMLTTNSSQQALRPVLLIATLCVVILVIARQIITMQENIQLLHKQARSLEELTVVHREVEEQSRQIAQQNIELSRGIDHLKGVQASLANGNLQARATLTHGLLWPLSASLNLMAERLTRFEHDLQYAQYLKKALGELSTAVQQGGHTPIPKSCYDLPEISQLITALQRQEGNITLHTTTPISSVMPATPTRPHSLQTPTMTRVTHAKETAGRLDAMPANRPASSSDPQTH